jgi:hypothetical protein
VYFECKVHANPWAYKVVWKHNVSKCFPVCSLPTYLVWIWISLFCNEIQFNTNRNIIVLPSISTTAGGTVLLKFLFSSVDQFSWSFKLPCMRIFLNSLHFVIAVYIEIKSMLNLWNECCHLVHHLCYYVACVHPRWRTV